MKNRLSLFIIFIIVFPCILYPEKISVLKPELVLEENENDPNYIFNAIADIAIDKDNNIYLLDVKDHTLHKFDENGKFITNIGHPGSGPGEFTHPLRVYYYNDEIMVAEVGNQLLHIFTTDGTIIKAVKDNNFSRYTVFHNMKLFADIKANWEQKLWELTVSDTDKNKTDVLASFPFGDRVYQNDKSFIMMTLERYLFDFDSKGNLYYGYCDDYSIYKYDGKNKTKLISKKATAIDTDPEKVAEVKSSFAKNNITTKPRLKDFITVYIQFDEKDNLYIIIRSEEYSGIDVYNTSGKLIHQYIMDKGDEKKLRALMKIANGYLWILAKDSELGYKLYRAKL